MMRLNKQLLNIWLRNIEVVVTIIWLICFLDVKLPSPLPKLIRASSYLIIAILVVLYWKRMSWVATRDIPLLLLMGTILASVFWSSNLKDTFDSCRGFVRMFLFGAYFTTRYSFKEQLKILAWSAGIIAILSLVVAIAIPSYGISGGRHLGAWNGIFTHKSKLGDAMSLSSIVFLVMALKDRRANWLAWSGFSLTIAINLLTDSASSLISLIVILLLIPLYRVVKQHYKLKTILITLACILAGITAIFILSNVDTILADILEQETNGRTSIWTMVIYKVLKERPWLGYGVNAFWDSDGGTFVALYAWDESRVTLGGEAAFNAHSSYIELFAALGFLGISVYAISLLTVLTRAIKLLFLTKRIDFFWAIQFLIFAHIAAISNVNKIVSANSSYFVIYASICFSTAIEWRRFRVSQKQYPMAN